MSSIKVVVRGPKHTHECDICISRNIYYLKLVIEQWCDVGVGRQVLYHGTEELIDELRLRDHPDVKGRTVDELKEITFTVDLQVTPLPDDEEFNIFLMSGAKTKQVMVRESEPVAALKGKVLEAFGLSPSLRLTLRRLDKEMEDHRSVSEYYVCPHCEVQVSLVAGRS